MLDPKRLWAKSPRKNESVRDSMLFTQHLKDVYAASDEILKATATDQLQALGLDANLLTPRFERCCRLAAALHDLGKANDHFQRLLRERNTQPQALRHEWVTVLLMEELRDWLLPAVKSDKTDFAFVQWAIAGHHPAITHPSPPTKQPEGSGITLQIFTDHPDFHAALDWLQALFQLPGTRPELDAKPRPLLTGHHLFKQLRDWEKSARGIWSQLSQQFDQAKLLAAIKAHLIGADVAGSQLPRSGEPHWEQLGELLNTRPRAGDLHNVALAKLNGKPPRAFQQHVADSTHRVTFVKAGCGTGKTVAAYLWAAQNHPQRRLIFCYPTTGTASEGFKQYFFETAEQLPGVRADLFHSRRDIDRSLILSTGADSSPAEAQERSEMLEFWSTPIITCTVDTVLGLVQNNRRGLFGWPAFVQSAFVFDEIHAYDDKLFGALLRFLSTMKSVPCLLMTASLPKARFEILQQILRNTDQCELIPIEGPPDLEQQPRYHKLTNCDNPLSLIEREIQAGGKVLWVSNTVARVMETAQQAEAAGLKPLIYHSRFKYVDRVQRHREVVDAFSTQHPGGVLACTSQVCEMSLDLAGCTLLVTDLAPVPALIQRLGRLNRHAKSGDPTKPFTVIEPEDAKPYQEHELADARKWLESLPDTDISQMTLASHWQQDDRKSLERIDVTWIDGGPKTEVKELREGAHGVTVIMQSDWLRIKDNKQLLGLYTLPMPHAPKAVPLWEQNYRGLPVVEDHWICYKPLRGAEWSTQSLA